MKVVKLSHRGFTLIEVLIALSLLSVMMLMLFAGLRIGAKSWDKGENKLVQVTEMSSVHNFFHNQLAASLPLWDDFTNKDKQFSFQGTSKNLQFVASLPASSKRLGLQRFNIRLENNKIAVAIKPFYPSLDSNQWKIEEVTLIDNIARLNIAYYGNENIKERPQWQSAWDYDHLPKLVAIEIKSLKENYWPKIVLKLNNKEAPKKSLNIFEKALKRSNKRNGNSANEKKNPFSTRRSIGSGIMGFNIANHYGGKLYLGDA
jgi:general secretion pathway protein J